MRGQKRTGMPAHPAHTSGVCASGAYPGRDAPAPQGLLRAQGGLQPAPSPVSGIRTPRLPLLPVWEKGAGGDEGQTRTGMPAHPSQRGARASGAHWRNARAPGAHLRCARLRRIPRQRRSSPAGASTRSGRASARTLSRFRHQDAQPPPSLLVEEGGWGMRGKHARECEKLRIPAPLHDLRLNIHA